MGQLETDSAVRDRYLRHFAMTKTELAAYFSLLTPGALSADGVYEVFNVPKTGVLRSRLLRLKKGTKVWKDSIGQPVLMMICGNPLTRGPNVASSPNPVAVVTGMQESQSLVPFEGDESPEIVMAQEPMVLATSSEPVLPEVVCENPPIVANVPTVTSIPSNPNLGPAVPALGAIASSLPWFAAPGLVGIAVGLPFVVPHDSGSSEAVPEPGTILALGVGVAAVLGRRLRSTKR